MRRSSTRPTAPDFPTANARRQRSPVACQRFSGRLVERYRPRLAVIACNTACTIALDHVRSALDLPVVGTVPAIKPAAEMSKTRVIGVLGTEATVRQPYVDDLAAGFASDCTIIRHGSPELVELAESKLAARTSASKQSRLPLSRCSMRPSGERIDTVVLACTHFPLLQCELRAAFPDVTYVDGGPGIARRIAYLTREPAWPAHLARAHDFHLRCSRAALRTHRCDFGIGEVRTLLTA